MCRTEEEGRLACKERTYFVLYVLYDVPKVGGAFGALVQCRTSTGTVLVSDA